MKKKPVWFYRIYFVVALLSLWSYLLLELLEVIPRDISRLLYFPTFLIAVPVVMMALSVFAFKFKYSTIGHETRRAAPPHGRLDALSASADIFPLNGDYTPTMITLFKSGIHLKVCYVWHVFIPWNEIEEIEERKGLFFLFGPRVIIHHSSHELRWRKITLHIKNKHKDFVLKMHELKNAAAEEK